MTARTYTLLGPDRQPYQSATRGTLGVRHLCVGNNRRVYAGEHEGRKDGRTPDGVSVRPDIAVVDGEEGVRASKGSVSGRGEGGRERDTALRQWNRQRPGRQWSSRRWVGGGSSLAARARWRERVVAYGRVEGARTASAAPGDAAGSRSGRRGREEERTMSTAIDTGRRHRSSTDPQQHSGMVLTSNTSLGIFAPATPMPSMGMMPLSLIPTFFVPLWTIIHIASLLQLRHARQPVV